MTKKRLLLIFITFTLFWVFAQEVFAVIQLDEGLRPSNLPDHSEFIVDPSDSDNPESAASQSAILFIGSIISRVLLFTGAIAVIFLIVAGANYIFAFGKDERIETAKRGIFWAIMGLVTVLLSYAIVEGLIRVLVLIDASA